MMKDNFGEPPGSPGRPLSEGAGDEELNPENPEYTEDEFSQRIEEIENRVEDILNRVMNGESFCKYKQEIDDDFCLLISSAREFNNFNFVISSCSKLEALRSRLNSSVECMTKLKTLPSTSNTQTSAIQLKKIELKPFSGEIADWPAFWNLFKTAVHHCDQYADITKFNYLIQALTEKANACISGLTVTAENYPNAIKALIDKYDNRDALVDTYYRKLDNLVLASDFEGHRRNMEQIQMIVNNLETLSVSVDQDILAFLVKVGEKVDIILKSASSNSTPATPATSSSVENESVGAAMVASSNAGSNSSKKKKRNNSNRGGHNAPSGSGRAEVRFQPYAVPDNRNNNNQAPSSITRRGRGSRGGNFGNRGAQQQPEASPPPPPPPAHSVDNSCLFCHRSNHQSYECRSNTSWKGRKEALSNTNRCLTCGSAAHAQSSCNLRNGTCALCQKVGHQPIMCVDHMININRQKTNRATLAAQSNPRN